MRYEDILEKNWVKRNYPVWKTVTVGGKEFDLVKITPSEMGLKERYYYWGSHTRFDGELDSADVADRGCEIGLRYVPREVLKTLIKEAETMDVERAVKEVGITQSGFGSPATYFILGRMSPRHIFRNRKTGEFRIEDELELTSMCLSTPVIFVKPRK